MKGPLFILIFSLPFFQLKAQECTVALDALKGTYEGDCKKEKANGKGTAKGEDSYTGEFKNGYPDGSGRYTWKNGNWHEGTWKKGVMQGQGTMHYTTANGKDSVQKGYWEKNKYIGLYKNPYSIYSRSYKITDLRFVKNAGQKNEITVNAQYVLGPSLVKAIETGVKIISGQCSKHTAEEKVMGTSSITFYDIIFPFRVEITYLFNQVLDIEISEAGNWTVEVKLAPPTF